MKKKRRQKTNNQGVHQQLFLILEDGEPARLHFAALFIVHSIHMSQVMLE